MLRTIGNTESSLEFVCKEVIIVEKLSEYIIDTGPLLAANLRNASKMERAVSSGSCGKMD